MRTDLIDESGLPGRTVLTTGAAMRLAFACVLVGALWMAVAWALS